ncbi:MAG: heavy metal translocating P-type ATPase, partial [Clostridiales bacterium]|nr:heavy metal translocating P-type ATPase [Clostridiales bacterium]
MEKSFKMEGLTCANCGEKIRCKLESSEYIESAELNFIKTEMKLTLNNSIPDNELKNHVQSITDSIESGITVKDMELKNNKPIQKSEDEKEKFYGKGKEILFIILSLALLIAGMLVPNILWLKLLIFLPAYLLVGYETLIRAAKNITKGQIFDENFLMAIASIGAFIIGEYPEA